ncbi:MAG TPA: hypothetical protein EYO01_05070 [Phycisphaerales bacterium]|nr:hypothetical protein [Phycisphaerales bacterium]HIB50813.1 hypothetical protein [Phycisphaerales bacterium]HIN83615.1 hypothetical protein [Phycisphaerales bacterium]HIO20160.1 hypothetical protein [Phycisphaerales bacterium]HIO52657.1 hypothetical protein [Phycisphaerales bacterium]
MFTITTLIASSIFAADVRIDQVLPENTIAFASVANIAELLSNVEQMGVTDMVCDIAQTIGLSENMSPGDTCPITATCVDLSKSLGEDGECSIPTGHAGWGLYPVVDYEVGSVGLGMFAMVELGESKIGDTMLEAFTQHSNSMDVEVEIIDISGRSIWLVQNEFEIPMDALPINVDLNSLSQLYFAITDGYLLFGTEPEGFASLFSAIDGNPIESSLASSDLYTSLMQRCENDSDAKAGLIMTNLADTFLQMDTSGMGMMILPMAKSLFGDIDGIAETINFSPDDDVLISGKYAIQMGDGRDGLMGLISTEAPVGPIPSFVGEDTISYSQNTIEFSKVIPLVKEIIANNPMLAMQMNPQMIQQIESGISMYISTLGSETHVISTGSEPFTSDSVGYLVAVECTDENTLSTVLGMTMPSMGATPSDFLGNQIFTVDFDGGMMMPMNLSFSIAVGGGYMFAGNQHTVENALRAIANPKDASSEHGLNAAASMLNHEVVSGWGYGNMSDSIKAQAAAMKEMQGMNEQMLLQVEEFDPEMAAEMRADAEQDQALQSALMNSMANFFGPMAWSMNADDTGFTAEFLMLKPVM